MSKTEYKRLRELEYLEKTGTLATVFDRMKDATEQDFEEL